MRGGSRIEDVDRGLVRICCAVVCALRKGEGGEESKNVKVKLPLKVRPLVVRCCAVALLRSGAVAQWRCCTVTLLRSDAVAQ